MTTPRLPDFDEPDLSRAVEALPPEALDRLPFGTIRLSEAGIVVVYNETERRLSGSGGRERLGYDFFRQVAPCFDLPSYRGRIDAAAAQGRLDLRFTHWGTFSDDDQELTVRVQSASDGGLWMFNRYEA